MTTTIPSTPTTVDQSTATVAVIPVAHLAHDTHDLPLLARFAVIAHTPAGGEALLATDADGVGNIVEHARRLAMILGARFDTPAFQCEYCGSPVGIGRQFCERTPGRDCAALFGGGEVAYWQRYLPQTALLGHEVAVGHAIADALGTHRLAA